METDILLNISKGDKTAFKYVFDTYYKSICLFIQKYIKDAEQSEDIAQDVFINIWEKKIKFLSPIALKAYLYQAAKNKALNVIEHEKVKKNYKEKVNTNLKSENFFYQNFIELETQRLIIQTVDKLPPRAREILYLNLEGYKNKEIAEQLGISVNTVKNHKATAYKFLKENLKDLILLITFILTKLN